MADSPFMLRPAARAAPPGFPPDVAPNQIIYAAHINAIRDSVAVWPGNVDGNAKTLSNAGSIGIGTAPAFKLDVVGGRSQFTASSEVFAVGVKYSAVSPVFWLGSNASGDLLFSEAPGPERMRLTAAGKLGIGTIPAGTYMVHVRSGLDLNCGIAASVTIGGAVTLATFNDLVSMHIPMEYRASRHSFQAGNVDIAGNLGIGTTSPAVRLDVQGGRSYLSAADERYALGLRYTAAGPVVWAGSDLNGDFIVSEAGGSERFRVKATGAVQANALPSVNPGAGSKQFWYDPADGNRVKFAA